MNKNQNGFSVIEAFLILVIVGLIGFVGWYVWQAKQSTDKDLAASTSTTATDTKQTMQQGDKAQLPDGWVWYEGEGFKFGYPKVFKGFTTDGKSYPASGVLAQFISGTPDVALFSRLSKGSFVLDKLAATNTPIVSRKYGPTIKLENNRWIVTQTNPGDPRAYKVGDVYNEVVTTRKDGTTVYTFTSGDEGGVVYTIAFTAKGHLYTLQLPEFDTGTYTEDQTPNDQKPYDQLATQLAEHVIFL